MEVILPEAQIKQIEDLVSSIIQDQIKNSLNFPQSASPYLNKQQACDYLGISNNTLDSWIKKGLPTIRIGKTVRFDREEIRRWLNNQ